MRYKPCRNVIISTKFGMMIVNRFDYNEKQNFPGVGQQLLNTRTENIDSIPMMEKFLSCKKNPVVIDVGANIGAFAIQVAKMLDENGGCVYAFEPQRQIFQMLNGNIAINNIDNVYTFQCAVGDKNGKITVPKVDYYKPASFGSIGLENDFDDVGQDLDFGNGEKVPLITLDSHLFDIDNIDVIKIDVEGMEECVVLGATEIIKKHRPLLYIEYIKQTENGKNIAMFLQSLNYNVYVGVIDFLCIPKEKECLPEYQFIRDLKNDDRL